EALSKTRDGAGIGRKLAKRFNWKIGDTVPVLSTIWPKQDGSKAWDFHIVGIFEGTNDSARGSEEMMLFQHEYFDQARQFAKGTVGWYITQVKDPSQAVAVGK